MKYVSGRILASFIHDGPLPTSPLRLRAFA
ncbi:hypothetical protein Pla8534_35210 [Lignipirellula cremea]|uniref:Uncharacterized protein n=1 Tax=Lignipirellula cremea TaxID=2528010 RepID=A0A518DLU4_9BACT|nr:hypothetical protein Pla8534_05660 [Lignipirellula cremea]QDU95704.1 hypothetical protein Pla8534_35210 [Lignipirellula cremea]